MYNSPLMNNIYGPMSMVGRRGLFSSLKAIDWSTLLSNTGKTLGIINQTIPIVYQVKPIINNAKTMLRIANTIKESDPVVENNNNNNNENYNNIESSNKPIFYI